MGREVKAGIGDTQVSFQVVCQRQVLLEEMTSELALHRQVLLLNVQEGDIGSEGAK